MGGPCHIARPDIGRGRTRSCAIRRGMSKKHPTAIFELSLRVGPVSLPLSLRNRPAKHAKRRERGSEVWAGRPMSHRARTDIGRGRDALLRDPAWHVQKRSDGKFDLSLGVAPAWLQARRSADTPIRRHRVLCGCGYAVAASFVTFCVHSL
jgi:hypothetical protein